MEYKDLLEKSEKIHNIDELIVYTGHPIPPSYTVRSTGDRPYSRFFYVVKGTVIFDADTDKQLVASAGDIVYLPGSIAYSSYWVRESNCEYISANCMLFARDGIQVFLSDKIEILLKSTSKEILSIFRTMHRIFYSRPNNWLFLLKSNYYNLLAKIISAASPKPSIKHPTAQVAGEGIAWVEFEYMQNSSLDDLAKKCGISKSTFLRNFKKLTGMSPIAYRNKIRLEHAYEILKTGIYSVSEVAVMVGFNDVPYFSRAFKKKFGISPGECITLGGNSKKE